MGQMVVLTIALTPCVIDSKQSEVLYISSDVMEQHRSWNAGMTR